MHHHHRKKTLQSAVFVTHPLWKLLLRKLFPYHTTHSHTLVYHPETFSQTFSWKQTIYNHTHIYNQSESNFPFIRPTSCPLCFVAASHFHKKKTFASIWSAYQTWFHHSTAKRQHTFTRNPSYIFRPDCQAKSAHWLGKGNNLNSWFSPPRYKALTVWN